MYDVTNNTGTNVGPAVRGRTFSPLFGPGADGLSCVALSIATYHKQSASKTTVDLCHVDPGHVRRSVYAASSGSDNTELAW